LGVSTSVTVKEAQTQLRRLFDLAQSGHEVIIEEPGGGKAKLIRFGETACEARVFGLHSGQVWTADDFDAALPDSFWLGGSNE
jgi:antitoxin (DNA-binding transcriptional repressor) of toxin-antitoxin stability system